MTGSTARRSTPARGGKTGSAGSIPSAAASARRASPAKAPCAPSTKRPAPTPRRASARRPAATRGQDPFIEKGVGYLLAGQARPFGAGGAPQTTRDSWHLLRKKGPDPFLDGDV